MLLYSVCRCEIEEYDDETGCNTILALTLTLIRGLPGSGKSTLAKRHDGVHLEADMYFVNARGEYHFNPAKLNKAHLWCKKETEYQLKLGNNVVVANTFCKKWEMRDYERLAKKYKARLNIIVCRGNYGSIHDVPSDTIAKMQRNWQE